MREFVKLAFNEVGIEIEFNGDGVNERGVVLACHNLVYQVEEGKEVVAVDPRYLVLPRLISCLAMPPRRMKGSAGNLPLISPCW